MSIHRLHQAARGLYKVAVVDARTREVVWEQKDWRKNLILNNGMDRVALAAWCDCFTYGIAGNGTTPTNRSSSEVTASQSGTTVTATSGSFTFTSGDVGNMIKWSTNEEARITAFTSGTSVEVTPSQSVAGATFVVYHTNQTSLAGELKRTATYLAGSPYCQTDVDLVYGIVKNRRTYDFTAETGTVSYTEVGVGWAASGGGTTFSRILLADAVVVNSGQQLRLVYELQITMTPFTPQSFTAAVAGWPVAPSTTTTANQQVQLHGLSTIAASGVTTTSSGGYANEPAYYGNNSKIWVSPSSTALAAFNSVVNRLTNSATCTTTLAAYVALSFYMDKTGVFLVSQANRTDLYTMGLGPEVPASNVYPAQYNTFCVLFDEPQTKANTQTLTLTFRSSWTRVLS